MKNQSAKKRRGDDDDDDDDGSVLSIDRLSELPQPILHHILSLLSQKEAVQTCAFSKSWRYLWYGRPILDISEKLFPRNTETFLHTVGKTLQRYHDQKLYLQDFLLEVTDSDSNSLLEKWIPIVLVNMNVKTLNLNLPSFYMPYFALPSVIFQAESLEELYLSRCKLSPIGSTEEVMFKNLQTLDLRYVIIEEETFENILSSCALIQCLVMEWCTGLRNINLVNIMEKAQNIRINSDYPRLNWDIHHNRCFPRLKYLHLHKVQLCKNSLDMFSSCNFPCLEVLELHHCNGYDEIQLSSHSIKRLSIMQPLSPIKASAIDAPNILHLELAFGNSVPSPFTFTKTSSCEWKSDIYVSCREIPDNYSFSTFFLNLKEMLKSLSQSQISVDVFCHLESDIVQTEVGSHEPVVVEHLKLNRYFPNLLNCLLRICHPRYIKIIGRYGYPRDKQKVSESFCSFLANERRECYSWHQDLEDFSIQVWDKNGAEWYRVEGTRWPADVKKVRLRLKWRDW